MLGTGELRGGGGTSTPQYVDLLPIDGVHHTSVPIRASHKLRPEG